MVSKVSPINGIADFNKNKKELKKFIKKHDKENENGISFVEKLKDEKNKLNGECK